MAHPEDTSNETDATTSPADQPPKAHPFEDGLQALDRDARQAPAPEPSEMGAGAIRAQLSTLSAALTAQRMQMQDMERSLVDRIADVDDDRRRGEGMLHRAAEAQRAALDLRLRHRGWLTAIGLLLVLAAAALALWLQQQRIQGLERELDDRILALTHDFAAIPAADSSASDALSGRLDALSQRVAQIAASVDRQARTRIPEPAEPSAETIELTRQIEQLEAKQRRLLGELQTLRALPIPATPATEAPADLPEPADDTPTEQVATIEQPSAPDRGTLAAPPTTTEAIAPSADQPVDASREVTVTDRPYALQLIGFFDRPDLLAFAADAELPSRVYIRTEQLRGRPWYALIHSLHPNYESASEAARSLPDNLAALQPWIRTLPEGSSLEVLEPGAER